MGRLQRHSSSTPDSDAHTAVPAEATTVTTASRRQGLFLLSLLFAAAPFVAGSIRALQTGSDMRLLWMAVAALVGGVVAVAIARARAATTSLFSHAVVAFALATVLTGISGRMLGARSGPGVWMIAVVFGLCWAASCVLDVRSREAHGHPG